MMARRNRPVLRIRAAALESLECRKLLATYYVAPWGNDSAAGTSTSTPWKSVAKVNSRSLAAGDKVLFAGGNTFRGPLNLDPNDRGTASKPIVIGSYGTGRATIFNDTGKGVYVRDTAGVEVRDLIVRGGGPSRTNHIGLHFQNNSARDLSYLRVHNVDVTGWGVFGLNVQGNNGDNGFHDVRLTSVKGYNNGTAAIRFDGKTSTANQNVYIADSQLYDNPGVSDWSRPSGSGIHISGTSRAVVEYNKAWNNGFAGNYGSAFWTSRADRVTFQYNSAYNNRAKGGKDGGGFDLDGGTTNSVVQYNWSANNDGNGYAILSYGGAPASTNNIIRYNISQNDGRNFYYASLAVGNNSGKLRDLYIYNNVVYLDRTVTGNTQSRGIWTHYNVPNLQVKNNVFYMVGDTKMARFRDNSGWDIKANVWYSTTGNFDVEYKGTTYRSLSAFANATGQEKVNGQLVGMTVNPMLVNPGRAPQVVEPRQIRTVLDDFYKLRTGTPLANKGVSLNILSASGPSMTTDFFGRTVGGSNRIDIGIHELV